MPKQTSNCRQCDKEFTWFNSPSRAKKGAGKYCSVLCKYEFANKQVLLTCEECGLAFWHIQSWLGRFCSHSCAAKGNKNYLKAKSAITGASNRLWKGDEASYTSIHNWVSRHFGKPQECEKCGENPNAYRYEWANKSGEYKRIRSDWMRLCVPCHRRMDREKRGNYGFGTSS